MLVASPIYNATPVSYFIEIMQEENEKLCWQITVIIMKLHRSSYKVFRTPGEADSLFLSSAQIDALFPDEGLIAVLQNF